MLGMISTRFWPRVYTRANTENYKDLGKNRGVQEGGQYFRVLTGPILYGINDFKHSHTYVWCLEYIKLPTDVGATFADSSSDYPFKQSNIFIIFF